MTGRLYVPVDRRVMPVNSSSWRYILQPTYFVCHTDNSFTVANPQPSLIQNIQQEKDCLARILNYDGSIDVLMYHAANEISSLRSKLNEPPMLFDPAFGTEKPFPSHPDQYRAYHGHIAWIFNPWTGQQRHPLDVGSDVTGLLIVPSKA